MFREVFDILVTLRPTNTFALKFLYTLQHGQKALEGSVVPGLRHAKLVLKKLLSRSFHILHRKFPDHEASAEMDPL